MTQAILFDLDGTLLDTAPDLTLALNQLLQDHNLPLAHIDKVRHIAGQGAKSILRSSFSIDPNTNQFNELYKQYLHYYRDCLFTHTVYFDGMEHVLDTLENNKITWGIVTNKPAWLAKPLLKALSLDTRSACLICGDTVEKAKPHPMPLLHASTLINKKPKDCLFVGDSIVDIQAGKAAGMKTILATYGYIPKTDDTRTWHADAEIKMPLDLLTWIEK